MSKRTGELSDKEKLFCDEYIFHRNGTRAYLKAFGCQYDSARALASKLLTKVSVRAYIDDRLKEIEAKYQVTLEECVGTLAKIMKSNIMDYATVDEYGNAVVDLTEMSREQAEAISSVATETRYTKEGEKIVTSKLTFYPKDQAALNLGKHFGGFIKKVEHSADDDLAALIKSARDRHANSNAE